MPSFRLATRDSSFDTPASFDTGAWDYYKTLAYDSLYNSPVGVYGIGDGPTGGVGRASELFLEKQYGSGKKLTPAEANEKYGMGGMLSFDENIYESAAQLMKDRKMAEYRREYLLQNGGDSFSRKATGLPVSMISSLVDPVNFASMFVSIVGQNKLMSGVASQGLERGLITPRQLASVVGTNRTAMRLATGAIEGGVGQAIVEPFVMFPNIYEQSNYGWEDSAQNVGAGFVLGAGLHLTFGKIGDKFNEIRSNFVKQFDVGPEGKSDLGGLGKQDWDCIDIETHSDAIKSAISDIIQDNPVTGPADVIDLNRKAIFEELKWDILNRSREEIAAHDLRQSRLGYDLLVEQYKNQGSRFMWNPEAAKNETKIELGGKDSFLKIREELTGQPYRPVEFTEENFTKNLDNVLVKAQEVATKMDLENFFEAGLDDLHPLQSIFKDASGAKGPEYRNFKDLYKTALKKGYDLENAEVRVGSEAIVFLTKNRAVKITAQDLTSREIPGLTTRTEYKAKRGALFMSASERVKILDEAGDNIDEGLNKAFNIAAKEKGYVFEDAYGYNVGINAQGDVVLVDTGKVFQTKAQRAESRLEKIKLAKERTSLSPENKQILSKLQEQLKRENPEVTKEMVDAEFERRAKNLIEKKRRQYKSEQKILANQEKIPEARESILYGQEIKKETTPIEAQTPDKIKEDSTLAKEQAVKTEEELRKPVAEEKPKAEDTEDYGDFTPEELKILEPADDLIKKARTMKKAVENGIKCISGKAI
jgi:hypothetical protein